MMTHYDGMREATEAGNKSQREAELAEKSRTDRIIIAKELRRLNRSLAESITRCCIADSKLLVAEATIKRLTTELNPNKET